MRVRKIVPLSGTKDMAVSLREIEHRKIARQAAAEGIVLLENRNHILPLEAGAKVALYGAGAARTIKGGTGSGDVNEREVISIYQGMKAAGFTVCNEEWIAEFEQEYDRARMAWRDEILGCVKGEGLGPFFDVYSATPFVFPLGGPIKKTEADVAFYVISRIAGEAKDRQNREGDYLLSEGEKKQLAQVCNLYPHVIVVINTGGLIDLTYLDELPNIDGRLYLVQPGMEGGNAFADVVSGMITPSGKLTDSWPYHYEDFPNSDTFSYQDGNVEKEYYKEGIYVGYRYFDTFRIPVKYGFGYGRSYTDFDIAFSGMEWDVESQSLQLVVSVTNMGKVYAGKEVIQVYATCPQEGMEKEFRRLVAFEKTDLLAPGECQKLELSVPIEYLKNYDEMSTGWILEGGDYVLWLGSSLMDSKPVGNVSMEKTILLEKTESITELEENCEALFINQIFDMNGRKEQYCKGKLVEVYIPAKDIKTEEIIYLRNADYVSKEAREFVETLSLDRLVALASGDPGKAQGGNLGAAGMTVPGSAGETSDCAVDDNLASIVLADGPAGLRLNKYYNVQDGKILQKPFEFSIEGGLFYVSDQAEEGERYYQYCTAIPVGTMLAQTWNCELIREVGAMVGREMEEFHVTLWLAPGMNIHRNPLCGRNFEYYSEDPVVSGKIAAAMTMGVQSVPGCGTTIKHLACNNQEDNRMDSNSIVSERVLREIYLRGFEIAVKESQPMAIMTSYNLLNGIHLANHQGICTKVVRGEWDFKGMIMTDWTTTEKGPQCTAAGCMRAGNDLVMPGALSDRENLWEELETGSLRLEDLRACIARLVDIIWQSNRYDHAIPYCKV